MPENKYYLTTSGTFVSEKELMHSSIKYIDLGPDEIMHWKYIKREKLSNGKYRYYYDESVLKKYENHAKRTEEVAKEHARYAAFADMDFQDKARSDKYSNKQRIAAADKYIEYQKRFRISNREAKKAAKRYELQKIISFPERTISKGIVAIANLLSKLGRKK